MLHLAFTGNPGTGKTTVARIAGRIYKQIGLLSKGHFAEVSRTDLIAGYTEPMERFFESNSGLKSRFNTFIEFPDYEADELEKILLSMCENNDYTLDDNACTLIHEYFEECVAKKDENFANGRLVRNLYDDLVMNHARRVVNIVSPAKEDLYTIMRDDFRPIH